MFWQVFQKKRFPLLPVQVSTPRINNKVFSTKNFSTDHHQVVLIRETQDLVHFFVGKEQ